MKLDSAGLKERYSGMTGEEFTLIKREHLTEEAQLYYDQELQRRNPAEHNTQEAARAKELANPLPRPKNTSL